MKLAFLPAGISLLAATFLTAGTVSLAGNEAWGVADHQKGLSYIQEGENFAKKGDWAKAKEQFTQAVNVDPENAIAHYDLGVALAHLGELKEAAIAEKKAIAIDDQCVQALVELSFVLSELGDNQGALNACRKALDIDPNNAAAKTNFKRIKANKDTTSFNRGRGQSSIAAHIPSVDKDILGCENILAEGIAAFNSNNFSKAKDSFNKAIETKPNCSAAYGDLGVVLGATGDYEAEIREEKRALQINPRDAHLHANLAWAYAKTERWQEALSTYQRAIELNPELEQAAIGQGLALFKTGQREAGIAVLKELAKHCSDKAGVHLALASILLESDRANEAKLHLAEAKKFGGENNPDFVDLKGSELLANNQWTEASNFYKDLVSKYPDKSEYYVVLGIALSKTKKLEAAIANFKKAIELDPDNALVHTALSQTLEEKGNYLEAEDEAQKALEIKKRPRLAEKQVP